MFQLAETLHDAGCEYRPSCSVLSSRAYLAVICIFAALLVQE